jgi:aminoglycoside phosphotransferase (APT) family kinase protein
MTAMNLLSDPPSEEAIYAMLQAIVPGHTLAAMRPTEAGHHNLVHILDTHSPTGEQARLVLKRYINDKTIKQNARLEFKTLAWLHSSGAAVPQPHFVDEDGALFGTPAIVTSFSPGGHLRRAVDHPTSRLAWVHEVAETLAKIHSVPWSDTAKEFLPPVDPNLLWFLNPGVAPDYMQAQPGGALAWQTAHDLSPRRAPVPAAFIHTDYYPGNILWDQGRITAVIDWEEASFGEPAADVGYCRMDMFLTGMNQAAAEFLNIYETATGRPVANLGFWELAAAARPMFRPAGRRIFESPARERLQKFLADAMRRAEF